MNPDLLRRLAASPLEPLRAMLLAVPLPEAARPAVTQLLDLSGLLVLAALLAVAGARAAARAPATRGEALGCAALALGFGAWLLGHPSSSFDALFIRWDGLAFAIVAGRAASALTPSLRKYCLAGISVLLLLVHCGAPAVAVLVGVTAAGLAWGGTSLGLRPIGAALGHAVLLAGLYGGVWWLQHTQPLTAIAIHNLMAFATLRYISLMIATVGAPRPALADWAMYTTFYPGITGLFGAPEMYSEFARRNLTRAAAPDPRAAARAVLDGVVLLVAATAVPMSVQRVEASGSAPEAWLCAVVLFVKVALGATGAWRLIHATALCLGVRLRMNFTGLLTCRTPAELWWAWRGTMTNWLVQHVYAPLGASRHHQGLNIFAAFAVSGAWHVLAVLSPQLRWPQVAAIGLWATINATAVIASLRLGWVPHAGTSRPRRALQTLSMWALGSLTPILLTLSQPGTTAARLAHLLRLLTGLH